MFDNLKDTVAAIAGAFSTVTGDDWTVEPLYSYSNQSQGYIVRPDGACIKFEVSGDRLVVTGFYGNDWKHRPDSPAPRITVAADREPTAIAKDIYRRFLSAYLYDLDQTRKTAAIRRADREKLAERKQKVLDSWPHAAQSQVNNRRIDVGNLGQLGFFGHVDVYSETANLELYSLSLDQVLMIAEIVANRGRVVRFGEELRSK